MYYQFFANYPIIIHNEFEHIFSFGEINDSLENVVSTVKKKKHSCVINVTLNHETFLKNHLQEFFFTQNIFYDCDDIKML